MKNNVIFYSIFFTFLFLVSLQGEAQDSPALIKLKEEVKKISEDPLLKYGQVGFSFRSSEGKVIYESNANKSLIPASNLKLLTTATALKLLGENYSFETKLAYDGEIKDGVLNGNIYIIGGGDPTLGSDRIEGSPDLGQLLSLWTQKIKEAGIKKINGTIIGDQSIFDKNSIPNQWIWTDIGNYYGAGASGLNINENLYKIFFQPGKSEGDSTTILRTEPSLPFLKFENNVITAGAGTGDNAYIYGGAFSNERYLSGTIPSGSEFSIKGSLPDPSYTTAFLLYTELVNQNIAVYDSPDVSFGSDKKPVQTKLIYTHHSPALSEIIRHTNVSSINLYAEALLKMIAVKKGLPGTSENGVKALTEYWKGRGLETNGMFLYDGSGLSPRTAMRATQFTKLLHMMAVDSAFTVFFKSLPIAGRSGTVSRFCKGTKAENTLFLKSGTLNRVICYTGYVKSKDGKYNSFSILVNNFEGTTGQLIPRIEKIAVLLTEF